jgi:Restriction endonuclease BamHI
VKLVEFHDILNHERFETSENLRKAWEDIKTAIRVTDWPHGSGTFTIFPGKQANGVDLIKTPCLKKLGDLGWLTEKLPTIKEGILTYGDLDALLNTPEGPVAFEWETGNISSSHRAINKLLLTSQVGDLLGSFLVVPSSALYTFLTDRVGNIRELLPYFPLWKSVVGAKGGLRIVVVEHDKTDLNVAKIPKRTDGRAKV